MTLYGHSVANSISILVQAHIFFYQLLLFLDIKQLGMSIEQNSILNKRSSKEKHRNQNIRSTTRISTQLICELVVFLCNMHMHLFCSVDRHIFCCFIY